MLVLIPVVWVWLAFGSGGAMDEAMDGTQLSTSMQISGKPIKIPAKKV